MLSKQLHQDAISVLLRRQTLPPLRMPQEWTSYFTQGCFPTTTLTTCTSLPIRTSNRRPLTFPIATHLLPAYLDLLLGLPLPCIFFPGDQSLISDDIICEPCGFHVISNSATSYILYRRYLSPLIVQTRKNVFRTFDNIPCRIKNWLTYNKSQSN